MKWIVRLMTVAVVAMTAGVAPAADNETAVKLIADVPYADGGDPDRNKLDLYLPEGQTGAPVLVFFHGGGYTKGDRKDAAQFGRTLAKHGVAVAAAGYRLLPANKYPAPVEDGAKAVAWVKANASKYGLAADKLFVGGHSAGGHLASVLATDPKLNGGDIRGVVSLSGGYKIGPDRVSQYGGEEPARQASPLTHVRAGLPAFFLAYADKDNPGKDKQTAEFADALKANKVIATVYEAKGREHGTLLTKIADGDPTGEAVLAFIRKVAAKK
ncbi:alpha/beta hydrolase [Fimbriiglobus ruber]|uniref:Putative lipase n=1 Tax=Fimbriiglobus ruber TaxID=1908690 RepID=A0A225DUW0_9BACT|nr:alpha/beta hydrolase [Fimbriiglobus ruber]OWK40185.1 putative lipase [Fimbriiglobus ruber]